MQTGRDRAIRFVFKCLLRPVRALPRPLRATSVSKTAIHNSRRIEVPPTRIFLARDDVRLAPKCVYLCACCYERAPLGRARRLGIWPIVSTTTFGIFTTPDELQPYTTPTKARPLSLSLSLAPLGASVPSDQLFWNLLVWDRLSQSTDTCAHLRGWWQSQQGGRCTCAHCSDGP